VPTFDGQFAFFIEENNSPGAVLQNAVESRFSAFGGRLIFLQPAKSPWNGPFY
jgi:hypothetical protein